jgi:hypothetical protein
LASWVARITGVGHWLPALKVFLNVLLALFLGYFGTGVESY